MFLLVGQSQPVYFHYFDPIICSTFCFSKYPVSDHKLYGHPAYDGIVLLGGRASGFLALVSGFLNCL